MNEPTERKKRFFSDDRKASIVRCNLGDKLLVSYLDD